MKLIQLLESKNRCLVRFLEVSERFSAEAAEGNWEGISTFNRDRDSIIKALDLFDRKVDEAIAALSPEERTEELLARIRSIVEEKDRLIGMIFKVDAVIVDRIENEKRQVSDAAAASRRGKSVIGKFKSGQPKQRGRGFEGEL